MYFCGTQDRLLQILRKTKNIQLFILVKIKQRRRNWDKKILVPRRGCLRYSNKKTYKQIFDL